MDTKTLHDYKMAFAALLQRQPKDRRAQYAVVVAKQVVGKEHASKYPLYVLQIADEWLFDPDVVAEMDRLELIKRPPEALLSELNAIISSRDTENRDRIKALELYGKLAGYIRNGNVEDSSPNQTLDKLQGLVNAFRNPVET